jgi:hypothetical protein
MPKVVAGALKAHGFGDRVWSTLACHRESIFIWDKPGIQGGFPMRLCRCARWLTPVLMLLLVPTASFAGVLISVNIAPPILPVYEQPLCPQDGWMWVPGYWAYGDDGYYWVPGEWVPAPYQGALWTPAWWGWDGGTMYSTMATGAIA